MAIITFSRQLGSLGDEIAIDLAKKLGYRFIDKAVVEEKLDSYGITQEKRKQFDERKPGFWASLSQTRDDYLHYLKTVLYEEAKGGNCIMFGRGAAFIMTKIPSSISIRIVAPFETRMERAKKTYSCNDKRAEQLLKQSDNDREGFHKYFFDMDWNASENYHAVFNSGKIPENEIIASIEALVQRLSSKDHDALGEKRINELILAQAIITELVYTSRIPIHFLEADVTDRKVMLHGVTSSSAAYVPADQAS